MEVAMVAAFEELARYVDAERRSLRTVRVEVIGPAARLCAAARVFVRHGDGLDGAARSRLLAQMDDAADGLQRAVSKLQSPPSPS
jgi:hypothetical protein